MLYRVFSRRGLDLPALLNTQADCCFIISALTHVVDAFLDPAMLAIILPLARSSSPDNTTQLRTHIAEVLRLHPPVCGTYRRAETDVDIPGCGMVKAGDRVYISYTEAQSEVCIESIPSAAILTDPSKRNTHYSCRWVARVLLTPRNQPPPRPPNLAPQARH